MEQYRAVGRTEQVEQNLIIGRAIVNLFSDEFLAEELRFRGGTALNKLHFPEPLRYSEDLDLVKTTKGPLPAGQSGLPRRCPPC
jgi:predicted nucleotidyltransferase component of viral defense system